MSDKIALLAPVLPADVVATARTLEQADLLESIVTRGTSVPFTRRPESPVADTRTEARWQADVVFYLSLAIGHSRIRATDKSFAYLDRYASGRVSEDLGAVFAREDCCVESFRRARQLSIPTLYQLPTAYWRKVRELMQREIAEFPNICKAANDPIDFAEERTTRKDAELAAADRVLCPSTFVRESLPEDRKPNAQLIPFAIDGSKQSSTEKPGKPVFLYVGNVTMRKGVHRLLIAWKQLGAYRTHELRLVGDMYLSERFLSEFRGMFTHIPRVSRPKLGRHYSESSALVFNSVADGFGHVILEAMAAGTPVLASRNSGAPDVLSDHIDGLLFDYGNDEQLATALNWGLSRPAELSELGRAAAKRARKRTWKDYGEELLGWMRPLLKHD